MKKLIILLLITSIVFVITSEGYSTNKSIKYHALYLPVSNTAPTAVSDFVSTCQHNTNIEINVQSNDYDIDGDLLTTSIVTGPLHGSAVLDGNQVKYTPNNNFTGTDYITYRICDNATTSLCDTAIITIEVNEVPSVNLGIDKIICSGDSVELGLSGIQGYDYNWFPALNLSLVSTSTTKASPTSTINYILTVTNTSNSCAAKDTIRVVVNSLPFADAGIDDTVCLGVSVLLGTPPIMGNSFYGMKRLD